MRQPQGAHLVGSVNYADAETTMRKAAGILGPLLRRIPDGEVGRRFHWIMFQPDVLGRTEGLERVGQKPVWLRDLDTRPLRIADGVRADELELPALGYAEAAQESYAIFTRLRTEGVISPGTRFQVSLPTPTAVVGAFFRGTDRAAIEPVYQAAMAREVAQIAAIVPHDDLAIQWDCAVEFNILETHDQRGGAAPWWEGDILSGLSVRAADAIAQVPQDIPVGVHLCYGDVAEKHFVEPFDTTTMVTFATELLAATDRQVTWLHLPVPIERDDDDYFTPLERLALPPETELYLGLVHREDGPEGANRRIETAQRHVGSFGVSTECGIGRAPDGVTDRILHTHAVVAAAW